MIPGMHSIPSSQLLPMLHQAWLSRASTPGNNSFIQTSAFGFPQHNLGFPFPNPFLVQPGAGSPELNLEKRRSREEAEDLSFGKRFKAELICPICSIAVRREDLVEHFETELKCLDNIRTLSPIARPVSRSYSTSPNKSSSLSPSSPGYLENRWERFQRIRSKRRERIGVKYQRRAQRLELAEKEEEIDIGDSLSDCGSASDTESGSAFGPMQYTEADVLRSLNEPAEERTENNNTSGMKCSSCSLSMITPVLNTSCWHLQCERCWLRTVGTSKICSTCSAPASVRDLRKVHV
ncbi:uncharacterized protein LOC111713320 [Eurytemora carolleeae]|uniref:uncharacterized protein LOC111713320 n=1 Tax=Eurytemora carolleeae TaxID=1294199 RepID=UPI000C78D386|nr:uncharacterized protein LOC111713320 [Eurytemora carolleeae]|eukprot:XP_023343927.1 uncharacterized protein LOC111713320 [Eurytemora affinis]